MKSAVIVHTPFAFDPTHETLGDRLYSDDCDLELLARVEAWKTAHAARTALREARNLRFNTLALALRKASR